MGSPKSDPTISICIHENSKKVVFVMKFWKTPKIVKENKNLMNLSSISAKSAIPNKLVISRTYAALPWIDLHWFGKVSFFLLLSLGICEKGWNLFCRYILIMSVGLESKSEITRKNIL